MKLYKALPCLFMLWAASALASSKTEFRPLISDDSKNRYLDALAEADHRDYQPALAKLESILMVDTVSVGIDKSTIPGDLRGYQDSVKQGVGIWQDSLQNCPYRLAHANERPSVVVKFVRSLDGDGPDLQGMIKAQHEFRWTGSQHTSVLTCTVFVVYRCDGRNLSHSEAAEVVAHELGHLLGLTDCPDRVGLMGPFVAGEPRLKPSDEELASLRQLRQLVRDEIDKIEDSL